MSTMRWNTVFLLTAVLLCSCTTTHIPELAPPLAGTDKGMTPEQFRKHVLMFDFRGRLLDPLSSSGSPADAAMTGYREIGKPAGPSAEAKPRNEAAEREYLQRVIDGIKDRKKENGHVEVLFFFHGGLNTRGAALARAARQIVLMRADRPDLYPVFVNWETSLPASYKDHLLWIRNGQDTYRTGAVLAPFVFAGDVGRSVLDIPVANYMQFREQRRHWQNDPTRDFVRVGTDCGENNTLEFRAGPADPPTKSQVIRSNAVSTITTILTKWWVAGLLSATGTKAWASMLYTSDRLFYTDHELHRPYQYTGFVTGSGGLSRFLRGLATELNNEDNIILVGHSAGTIPASKIVAMFGESLPIRTLVYMAPASTIDELKDGGRVAEFLRRSPVDGDGKPTRKLYILTLHERAEVSERFRFDLTPRGTLLAWLDEFIQPKHSEFPGMMMGRARNLRLHAHHIPCKIRPQIFITSYAEQLTPPPKKEDRQPQRHGAFGELDYWLESTWHPQHAGIVAKPHKRE